VSQFAPSSENIAREFPQLELDVSYRWCQYGTMKRMNLRDVPDDVYAALSEAAAVSRQSLNAYVVDRLTEAAQAAQMGDYLSEYRPAEGSEVTLEDAVTAVREVREAS
jgi:hypothetical protein